MTTSLKMSEELKRRAIDAARRQGISTHAFMLRAIDQAATAAMLRDDFVANALAAKEQAMHTGEGYAADAVHAYIKARIVQDPDQAAPKAISWQD